MTLSKKDWKQHFSSSLTFSDINISAYFLCQPFWCQMPFSLANFSFSSAFGIFAFYFSQINPFSISLKQQPPPFTAFSKFNPKGKNIRAAIKYTYTNVQIGHLVLPLNPNSLNEFATFFWSLFLGFAIYCFASIQLCCFAIHSHSFNIPPCGQMCLLACRQPFPSCA